MSQYTHEGIRNLSPVSYISLALLFFYFYNIDEVVSFFKIIFFTKSTQK